MSREQDLLGIVQRCVERQRDPIAALEAACLEVGLPRMGDMERLRRRVAGTLDYQVFPDDFPEVQTYVKLVRLVVSLMDGHGTKLGG